MARYHIGTRLRGYPKDYLKALSCEISKKYNLNSERKIVPHLTFVPPFETDDESELVKSFDNVLSKYSVPKSPSIIYDIDGFGVFDNEEKVIYAKIKQNEPMKEIALDLRNSLEGKIKYFDNIKTDGINLHCTLAGQGINGYYGDVMKFLQEQNFEKTRHPLFRVYLLKDNFILREFDFYLDKSLERFDAINPFVFDLTKTKFSEVTNYKINGSGIILPKTTINL